MNSSTLLFINGEVHKRYKKRVNFGDTMFTVTYGVELRFN